MTALSPGLGNRQVVWLLVCFAGLLLPATVWGQAGYYFRPGLSVAEYYDDNIFRTSSDRKDDMVSRLGAGAEAGYQSEPFTILGHYRFDSEIYAKNSKLTDAFALQDAGAEVAYRPTRLWTLDFAGGWVDTRLPETINTVAGILGERVKARNYSLSPSIIHLWDPLTTLSALYTFNSTSEARGITTDSHTARFVIDRRLSERDAVHLGYMFRKFQSSVSGTSLGFFGTGSETSHTPTVGWTHQLSLLTSFTVNIGPRFSSTGDVTPEVLATVARELQNGKLTFTYARTQYTVVGLGDPVTTDSVLLSWEHQLANRLLLNVSPGFYNNSQSSADEKSYALDIEVLYQINKWLGFRGSYQFTYEDGRLFGAVTTTQGQLYRNIVLFELVAFYPMRVY
jgi:hypothetical protein